MSNFLLESHKTFAGKEYDANFFFQFFRKLGYNHFKDLPEDIFRENTELRILWVASTLHLNLQNNPCILFRQDRSLYSTGPKVSILTDWNSCNLTCYNLLLPSFLKFDVLRPHITFKPVDLESNVPYASKHSRASRLWFNSDLITERSIVFDDWLDVLVSSIVFLLPNIVTRARFIVISMYQGTVYPIINQRKLRSSRGYIAWIHLLDL